VGDPAQLLQEGLFKFVSQDGDVFGRYTLTVVRGQGDPTPLSPTYQLKTNSFVGGGQQSNIVFERNYQLELGGFQNLRGLPGRGLGSSHAAT